jgi:hypothetical protein
MLPVEYVVKSVISFSWLKFWQYEYVYMVWNSLDLSGIRNECKQTVLCSFVLPFFATSKCYQSGKRCKIGYRNNVLLTCLQCRTASSTFRCLVVSVVSYHWLSIVVLSLLQCHTARSTVQCCLICSVIQLDQPCSIAIFILSYRFLSRQVSSTFVLLCALHESRKTSLYFAALHMTPLIATPKCFDAHRVWERVGVRLAVRMRSYVGVIFLGWHWNISGKNIILNKTQNSKSTESANRSSRR